MNRSWTLTTLGALVAEGIAKVQTGPFGTVLKAAQYSSEGVPLISVGEIRYGNLEVFEHTPRISEETKERLPQFILEEGDIVFGRKGAIDRNAIINSEQSGWFLGSDGIRLRVNESCDSTFLSYQLRCPAIGEWLLRNSSGSIMPSLNQKILDRLPVWLTDISEQAAIAKVLSTLDAKITLNRRLNAELEAMAKLLYDYWFVQFDFPISAAQATAMGRPDLEGKPYRASGGKMVYNKELKREIPEGWGGGNILAVSRLGGGATPSKERTDFWDGNIPFFTPTDGKAEPFCLDTEDHITELGLQNSATRIYEKGTVFITARGSVGKAMIISSSMAMNQSCYALNPIDGISPPFLYFHVLSLMDYLRTKSSGSIFKSIVTNDITFTPAVGPPQEVVTRFSKVAVPVFEQILVNQKQTQHLTQLRDWLLPMLMNGQVTVGDPAATQEG